MPLKVSLTDQVAGPGLDADRHESRLSPPRIVCAANRLTFIDRTGNTQQLTIAGARHMDSVMHPIRRLLMNEIQGIRHRYDGKITEGVGMPPNTISEEQGFIDQHGQFYTREQAFVIATANNQIRRKTGGVDSKQLFSEDLY